MITEIGDHALGRSGQRLVNEVRARTWVDGAGLRWMLEPVWCVIDNPTQVNPYQWLIIPWVPIIDEVQRVLAAVATAWDAGRHEHEAIDFKQTPDSAGNT